MEEAVNSSSSDAKGTQPFSIVCLSLEGRMRSEGGEGGSSRFTVTANGTPLKETEHPGGFPCLKNDLLQPLVQPGIARSSKFSSQSSKFLSPQTNSKFYSVTFSTNFTKRYKVKNNRSKQWFSKNKNIDFDSFLLQKILHSEFAYQI